MQKETTPLAKAITTLEGQLVIISDLVLAIGAAIPAHVISPKVAAIVVGAQHVALLVQRGVIKARASKSLGSIVDAPDPLAAFLENLTGGDEVSAKPESAVTPDIAASEAAAGSGPAIAPGGE